MVGWVTPRRYSPLHLDPAWIDVCRFPVTDHRQIHPGALADRGWGRDGAGESACMSHRRAEWMRT